MGARKALCKPRLALSETKLALLPGSAAHPVQNSPSERPWQAHPVQNSPSTPGSAAHPVQNSPSKRPWQAHPVQNSPSKPQNADFGPLFACRENFVPLPPPTTRAGRTLSRMRCHFRYKTLPASPKTPISAHFSHAGRTLYRFRHQHDKQGEKSHAPTPHRTHQRAPPQISHAIRLNELSTKPRNVAIPPI